MKTQAQPSPASPLPPAHRRALDLVAIQRRQAVEADEAVAVLRTKVRALFEGADELDAMLAKLARGAGLDALGYMPERQIEAALRAHVLVGGMVSPIQSCTSSRLDLLETRIAEAAALLVSDDAA